MLSEVLRPPRAVPLAITLVSALALGAALVAQFGFGLQPCQLCIWQRWPYVAALALGLIGAGVAGHATARRAAVGLTALAFLVGAGIAGFHAGVEYGWWQGLPGCAGDGLSGEITADDLQAALSGQDRLVPCDEPAFVVAGLSMAGWNFVLSLGLAVAALVALRRA